MGLISVSGNYWNAISKQDCLIVAIFLNIDYGIINLSNGTYIGVANGNDLYENSTSSTYFFPFMNSYCISYARLPSVNPLLPKCNQIISDVMFYNVSNNYSIVASVNIIFELGFNMNVKGMFRPSTESFSVRLNDEGYSDFNNTQNFTQNFSEDSKFKLSIFSESLFGDSSTSAYIGKIIHRNGIVLMEEDRPFTHDDICQDIPPVKSFFKPELLIVSSLCCSSFVNE